MDGTEEEFVPEEETDGGPAALKSIREKLKKAVAEKQEYLEGWQRTRADFANFKREEAAALGEKESRIKADFVESILPALDSFEMALRHAPSKEYEIVYNHLLSSLKAMGVEKFGNEGDAFNPHIHEPLMQKGDGETIQSVERSGYKINDHIIRAAQVII
jgi:molecular chaperone GrpE